MKSYSNCSNAGETNINLPNFFCSKLCLSPRNHHINNLKNYEDFAEGTNSLTVVIINMKSLSLMMLHVWVNWNKEDSSFHQADLTEIQVINKNIKGLNTSTIYRTFNAINENKGIQRRPGSGRNSTISKSTFEIIKKYLEIDNGLTNSELSNKIFEDKGVKISSEAIQRYLVSQNYKYEKPKVLIIYLSDLLKKKRIDFEKKKLGLRASLSCFYIWSNFLLRSN